MKLTLIPTVHHVYVIRKIIFIYNLGGKVKNILKNPPRNNTNIPICKRPLIIHISPFFLMFL